MYQAFRRGMQSVADSAAARNFAEHLGQTQTAERMAQMQSSGLSAQELATAYPEIQAQANRYANNFLSNVKPVTEDNMFDAAANFAGRKVKQVGSFAMENPAGQMALFSAPMLLPMVMGGGNDQQETLSPEAMVHIQREQMMRQQYGG